MTAKSRRIVATLFAAGIALSAAPRTATGQELPPGFAWQSLPPMQRTTTCDANGTGGFAPKAGENHAREGDVSSRAKPDFKTLIAHRGECFAAPENTLPAFEIAVERGFGFECDVQLSADGRVFTMHDLNLKRMAGIDLDCAKASWEAVISKLDVGHRKGDKWKGTRPALLEEVLPLARDGRYICVELKAGPAIIPYVKRIIEAQDKANSGNLLFISFFESSLLAVKRELPGYKTILVQTDISAESAVEKCRKFGFDGVSVRYDAQRITEEYARTVHDAGLELHVWTIGRLEDAIAALSRGVDIVVTNFAKRLKDEFDASNANAMENVGEGAVK